MAKQKAEALIEQLAAAPDFDSMIEHNSAMAFPSVSLSSFVRGTETPALAFTQTADTLGLICWLFKDELLAKIGAGIDEAADDEAALSQAQRDEIEAEIGTCVLAAERSEVACIWAAEAKGEIIDCPADTSPQALARGPAGASAASRAGLRLACVRHHRHAATKGLCCLPPPQGVQPCSRSSFRRAQSVLVLLLPL